jgi:aspartate/methionine/tyrosine aminotransferase
MLERLPALELAERAEALRCGGADIVPIRGVPMLRMPEHVTDAVARAAAEVFPRQSRGSTDLKAAISQHLHGDFGLNVDPDTDLLITHGAQHGMSVVLRALLNRGDEVLIPAPSYFFDGTVRLAGAVPRYVLAEESENWSLPLDQLQASITPRSKAIILCNPNNPTGSVPARQELLAVLGLAARHGLYVISDESYERYVHGGPGYVPQMSLTDAYSRLITVTSLSKNYAFTSWRIGYVHAPSEILKLIHRALEWDAINVGDIPQIAATAAISGPQEWLDAEFSTLRKRRDLLLDHVAAAGFYAAIPMAGVFAFVNLEKLGVHGPELEDMLLSAGITALGGDRFYGPGTHARLLYGGTEENLGKLGHHLQMLADRTMGSVKAPTLAARPRRRPAP